jgi:hypothetical protein
MEHYICTTCGTEYEASPAPPLSCAICEDERQYVNWKGQSWITQEELCESYSNTIRQLEPKLYGIYTEPNFAIGQRALLVRSPSGNFMWDCLSLIDEAGIRFVEELGGLQGIGLSHPHFYGAAVAWSKAFGGVPIYIHASDRKWVMRNAAEMIFWDDLVYELWDGLQIRHCGGHFEGSTVLFYPEGAGGRGAIFTSDTLHVSMDRQYVSFMRSYPNYIPLSAKKVRHIASVLDPLSFDRIYGGWLDRNIYTAGKEVLNKSVNRYIQAILD